MKRIPKYKTLPAALLIYFIAMTIYGLKRNHWHLQEDFWTICIVEFVVITVLFISLKYLHRKREE